MKNANTRKQNAERAARLERAIVQNHQDAADLNAKIAAGERFELRTSLGTYRVLRASVSIVTGPMIHTDGNGGFGQSFCARPSDCVRVE